MTQPETSPAEPGAVAYLLSRLNTDSPLQRVTIAARRSGRFRLYQTPPERSPSPCEDGTEHRLLLGGARLQR